MSNHSQKKGKSMQKKSRKFVSVGGSALISKTKSELQKSSFRFVIISMKNVFTQYQFL